jgi:hypothetical protein
MNDTILLPRKFSTQNFTAPMRWMSIGLAFICWLAPHSAATAELDFYRDLKSILIEVNVESSTSHAGIPGAIREMTEGKFPFPKENVEEWLTKVLENEVAPINVLPLRKTKHNGIYGDKADLDKDKIYMRLNIIYWDKAEFSPSLNHSVILVKMEERRTITKYRGELPPEGVDEKQIIAAELLSVPEDSVSLKDTLNNLLSARLDKLMKSVKCANGRSCKGL